MGKADYCSNNKNHKAKRYDWANISGKYKRDFSDYKPLCRSCHEKMDYTEERRKKVIGNTNRRVAIDKHDKQDKYIESYPSIREAAAQNNVLYTSIVNNLKGLSKSAGGYIWHYR